MGDKRKMLMIYKVNLFPLGKYPHNLFIVLT